MTFAVIRPDELSWITRAHEPGEPARHVAELSDRLGFGLGTALQSANHGDVDLLVYAYGYPREDEHAELLAPAV